MMLSFCSSRRSKLDSAATPFYKQVAKNVGRHFMRVAIFIIVVSFATSIAGAASAADEMTEDKCVKEFLEKPVKDWKGYDNCRRGATQLKIRGADGLASRSLMLPQTNALPNTNGAGTSGNANVR